MEYAVLIVAVVAGLLAMQVYFKRALEGRIKNTADGISDPYDARHVSSSMKITLSGSSTSTSRLEDAGFTDPYGQQVLGYASNVEQEQTLERKGTESYGAE